MQANYSSTFVHLFPSVSVRPSFAGIDAAVAEVGYPLTVEEGPGILGREIGDGLSQAHSHEDGEATHTHTHTHTSLCIFHR